MVKDLKVIVSELDRVLKQRGNKDGALALIHRALQTISEQEVGFIDTSGEDPSTVKPRR